MSSCYGNECEPLYILRWVFPAYPCTAKFILKMLHHIQSAKLRFFSDGKNCSHIIDFLFYRFSANQFFRYWPAKFSIFTERLFSPSDGLHYRYLYTIAIRGYAKDWTVTGPQDQLRSGLISPPSSFAGLNYYLFVLNIKIQLVWRANCNRNQLV